MEILKFTDDHKAYRERLAAFLADEVVPLIPKCEKEHLTPKSMWRAMGKSGFLCPWIEKEYGGQGLDFLYSVIVWDEVARINFTGLAVGLHSDIVVPYVHSFGSEAQKQAYLPGCVSGDIIAAVAMTEPGAGSDVASMETTAVQEGDEIILNGSKTFISNGVNCDLVVLAARSPEVENPHQAISLYLVEEGTPGFTKGKPFEKMGWASQDTAELFFSDCRIPVANRLGNAGDGFLMLMQKLQQERLVCAVGGVFGTEAMLARAVEFCKTRKRNGKPLSKYQSVQFALVEMATELEIQKNFAYVLLNDHMAGKQVIKETSMAKYRMTEMSKLLSARCLDIMGPEAAMESHDLARMFRDARVTSIFAGTNEIMKTIIAKTMGL
ncbi:acyl-CoA dehydrogenase [Desulfosarcina alkanivorans]|uniref:Acyl-CoA dehydrogenase n=1 Tax=Desulfosarcina alkanivorans TaxID=571177 RepID=A0A5K7YLV5_9BACT|nr:acyl-CoA dehydrogenase family protein [Desulfosarcina alkanivorans]BBO69808.1 acyl-CoA dehydrogenase [Desulfosarcina alkanivorans]